MLPVNTSAVNTDASSKENKENVCFGRCTHSFFNKWKPFDTWACNAPTVSRFESSQLLINSPIETKRHLYRLLLLAETPVVRNYESLNFDNYTTTWMFYEETNSWKIINNVANEQPPMNKLSKLKLVTLCRSHAIVVQLDDINGTWIFMFKQLIWKRVTIAGNGPQNTSDDFYKLFAAVAVRSVNNSCPCSEDVLVFVYVGHPKESITQVGYYWLSWVEHTGYRWKKVGYHIFRSDLTHIHFVDTLQAERTLYFIVGKCVWTYCVEKSFWNDTKNCVKMILQ